MTTSPESADDPDLTLHDADRISRLIEVGSEVAAEIAQLSADQGNQFVSLADRAAQNKALITKQRRFTRVLAASVALDIALSVFLGVALNGVSQNNHRVGVLTDRLNLAQTTQRQKALCPLYGLFLASENLKARAAYPQGPAAYDRNFVVIRQGYDALGCSSFIVRTPG